MTHDGSWRFNVLAGAATVFDGQFLLLRRSGREGFLPGVWGIPAGQLKRDEDPQDGCLRELFEETHLKGERADLIGYSMFRSRRHSVPLTNHQLNFLVEVTDREVTLDETTHSAAAWISLDDADDVRLDDFTRNIMRSARDAWCAGRA